jgi:hypothetical protein
MHHHRSCATYSLNGGKVLGGLWTVGYEPQGRPVKGGCDPHPESEQTNLGF